MTTILIGSLVLFAVSTLAYQVKRFSALNFASCFLFVVLAPISALPMLFVFVGMFVWQAFQPKKAKKAKRQALPIHGETTLEVVSLFLQGDL